MEDQEPIFNPKKINYVTWLLLAAVACMFYIIYQKNEQKHDQKKQLKIEQPQGQQ